MNLTEFISVVMLAAAGIRIIQAYMWKLEFHSNRENKKR